MPATAAAMIYPFAVRLFVWSLHAAQQSAGVMRLLSGAGALVTLATAIAPPVLALRSLHAIRDETSAGGVAARRLLHIAVAVPPLYLISIRVAGGMTALGADTATGLGLWWGTWALLAALAWNAGRPASFAGAGASDDRRQEGAAPRRFLPGLTGESRRIHRIAVVAILAGFLVLHLANHVFALWTVPAQRAVMLALRGWYRAVWMEPVILGLFAVAAGTGLIRLMRLTRARSDGFRVLQTASGCYLAFFLVSHVWATLGARYHGIDTDWAFASGGKAGMLATGVSAAVLLYYVFALIVVGIHAGLGLRMVLLSRRVRAPAADRAARLVMACGGALTVAIVAALLGVRLGP